MFFEKHSATYMQKSLSLTKLFIRKVLTTKSKVRLLLDDGLSWCSASHKLFALFSVYSPRLGLL